MEINNAMQAVFPKTLEDEHVFNPTFYGGHNDPPFQLWSLSAPKVRDGLLISVDFQSNFCLSWFIYITITILLLKFSLIMISAIHVRNLSLDLFIIFLVSYWTILVVKSLSRLKMSKLIVKSSIALIMICPIGTINKKQQNL